MPAPAKPGSDTAELSRHAWSLLRAGKRQEALKEFDRLIELDPDNAAAYRGRGIILVYFQKAEKAKADLEKSLSLEPSAQGYFALGAACINLDLIEQAVKAYDSAMRLKLGSHMAHMMRGRCYYVLGKYDLAVKDFDQAISLKPSVWKFHIYRAQAYEALGKKKLAEKEYEQAFLLEPEYATAFFQPDMIKSIKEIQASGARVTVRQGSLQGPSPQPELWFRRGLKRLKAGQNQAAMSDFMVVSQADSPLSDFAGRFRGLTYLQMKHYDQALCGLNVALFYDRTWVTGYYYKAKTLELLGRRAEAARFYKLYLERLARAGGVKAKDPMGYESPGRYEKEVRQWLARYKK
ncbi:MAG: tetratricopeptide repeat protein [Candidatus Obscuribacterales bacterium]